MQCWEIADCIKKAKEMLKSDYGSISEIAESLGYLNIYDFSRIFKKHIPYNLMVEVKNEKVYNFASRDTSTNNRVW